MKDYDIKVEPTEHIILPQRRPNRDMHSCVTVGRPGPKAVRIVLAEEAFLEAHHHAASSLDEIGGALIGQAYTWKRRTYVEVNAVIPGIITQSGRAHATFTADTWAELLRQQERVFPDQMIVGWYHSHPRMGIFLSGMDLSIQRGFFQSPWHIALVINAQDRKGGFFAWEQDEIEPVGGFYLMGDGQDQLQLTMNQHQDTFLYHVSPMYRRLPPFSWRVLVYFSLILAGGYLVGRWFSRKSKRSTDRHTLRGR